MRAIYVEIVIAAPLAEIWEATQDPAAHCRWDARFGRIEPVPGTAPAEFRYATAVLPGVEIGGFGIHAGQRDRPDGTRTSALRFGSADPRSLIADGRGCWRYVPGPHGVRFLTGYTYTPRWGVPGRLIDVLFRPVFGWATACRSTGSGCGSNAGSRRAGRCATPGSRSRCAPRPWHWSPRSGPARSPSSSRRSSCSPCHPAGTRRPPAGVCAARPTPWPPPRRPSWRRCDLGTHQHIAVDLELSVDAAGGLRIRSAGQRFRGGVRCPRLISGEARLHEWYDDAAGRFRIEVAVENRRFGPIFGYSGSFTAQYVDRGAPVPAAVRPLRENARE